VENKEKDFHICHRSAARDLHPLCSTLSQRGLNPIKLAYITTEPDGTIR